MAAAAQSGGASQLDPRAPEMHRQRLAGATLKDIGASYGLTKERARQILKAHGGPTRIDAARARDEARQRAHALDASAVLLHLIEHPGARVEDVAQATGLEQSKIHGLAVAGGCVALLGDAPRSPAQCRATYTDEEIFVSLRAAASDQGGAPLTTKRYRHWREEHPATPSTALLVLRLGSWARACELAGVQRGATMRKSYTRSFTDDDCVEAVATFLLSGPRSTSVSAYDTWRHTDSPTSPSVALMRIRLGTWGQIKALAHAKLGRAA